MNKKLHMEEFFEKFEYCYYQRITKKRSSNGIACFLYRLCKNLTAEDLQYLKQFSNVSIGKCYYKYSPQQKHDYIKIYDKGIKTN